MTDVLAAQRGGAKSLLLTVLGEFVLPAGGAAWTSTLVAAADAIPNPKTGHRGVVHLFDQDR